MDVVSKLLQRDLSSDDRQSVFKVIVNTPFEDEIAAAQLSLGIVVLLLVDPVSGTIHRAALSDTDLAKSTTNVSAKRFEEIKIPLTHQRNIIAKAVRSNRPHATADWYYLFTPELTAKQARLNQAAGAIAYSCVHPFRDSLGALIFSYYQHHDQIGKTQTEFMKTYTAAAGSILKRIL